MAKRAREELVDEEDPMMALEVSEKRFAQNNASYLDALKLRYPEAQFYRCHGIRSVRTGQGNKDYCVTTSAVIDGEVSPHVSVVVHPTNKASCMLSGNRFPATWNNSVPEYFSVLAVRGKDFVTKNVVTYILEALVFLAPVGKWRRSLFCSGGQFGDHPTMVTAFIVNVKSTEVRGNGRAVKLEILGSHEEVELIQYTVKEYDIKALQEGEDYFLINPGKPVPGKAGSYYSGSCCQFIARRDIDKIAPGVWDQVLANQSVTVDLPLVSDLTTEIL